MRQQRGCRLLSRAESQRITSNELFLRTQFPRITECPSRPADGQCVWLMEQGPGSSAMAGPFLRVSSNSKALGDLVAGPSLPVPSRPSISCCAHTEIPAAMSLGPALCWPWLWGLTDSTVSHEDSPAFSLPKFCLHIGKMQNCSFY